MHCNHASVHIHTELQQLASLQKWKSVLICPRLHSSQPQLLGFFFYSALKLGAEM